MTSINLDSIHHYQPVPSGCRPVKGRSVPHNSMSPAQNAFSIDTPKDHDIIQDIDLTTSVPTETPNPFSKSAQSFKGMKLAQGIVH